MKNALRISLLLIALLFLLAWRFAPARQASDEPEPSGEVRRPDAAVPDHTRTLRVLHGGAVEEMTMDEYLLGVLRAEMPASFELEALKAQAVAARTYTLHKMAQGAIPTRTPATTSPAARPTRPPRTRRPAGAQARSTTRKSSRGPWRRRTAR